MGIALALAAAAGAAFAEGPGSRIGTGSDVPRFADKRIEADDARRCEQLEKDDKQRCLVEARKARDSDRTVGPASTGMGSGAGSSASPGSTGAAGPR